MTEKKKISRDTYLKALGLMTLAANFSKKTYECRDMLEEILGVPESDRGSSHFADEIYGDAPNLDEALKRADYVVED